MRTSATTNRESSAVLAPRLTVLPQLLPVLAPPRSRSETGLKQLLPGRLLPVVASLLTVLGDSDRAAAAHHTLCSKAKGDSDHARTVYHTLRSSANGDSGPHTDREPPIPAQDPGFATPGRRIPAQGHVSRTHVGATPALREYLYNLVSGQRLLGQLQEGKSGQYQYRISLIKLSGTEYYDYSLIDYI